MAAVSPDAHFAIFEALRQARGTWESHWTELRDVMHPVARRFNGTETPGAKNRQQILDGSAESYGYNLSAALAGFLINPATRWMGLRARPYELNDDRANAIWLAHATDVVLSIFEAPESRYYTQMGEVFDDTVFLNTCGLWIADRPGKLPLFQHRPLSELYISQNAEGVVDTVYRDVEMSARQAVRFFNGNAGEKATKAAAEPRTQEEKFRFLHCVYPRDDAKPDSVLPRELPFASEWYAMETKETLRISGTHEMSMIIGRWRTRDGEAYGRGPAMNALPDVNMLQRVQKATIRGAEKTIDPPLIVGHDGVMTPVATGINNINVVRTDLLLNARRPMIEGLQTGARPDFGETFSEGIRRRISEAFLNHLVHMVRDPRMTATQVLKIDEETLRVLGPVLGRMQSEIIGPTVARTFGIALRAGMLPPPPEALLRGSIEVEYVSPIAKAQRLSEASAIASFYEVTGPMRAGDPAIDDNVDADAAYRHVWDRMGAPLQLLRDPKAVETRRKARQEAAREEAESARMAEQAKAAQSATQALAALKQNTSEAA